MISPVDELCTCTVSTTTLIISIITRDVSERRRNSPALLECELTELRQTISIRRFTVQRTEPSHLQQVDPVTRRADWSRVAAAKLGRLSSEHVLFTT